jgi:hypothetical protein
VNLKLNYTFQEVDGQLNALVNIQTEIPGPDIIRHTMLQVSPEKVAVPLRIFFNKSLEQCKYPKLWKKTNVIPIFKKGFPFFLVNLKLNYIFQEVDGQLNALVKIQTEIHISALSFGDDYKRVYTLLFRLVS